MPKLTTTEKRLAYEELNDLRRNLKIMTSEETERFIHGESLRSILKKRFIEKRI